jgi:hypothetical protein
MQKVRALPTIALVGRGRIRRSLILPINMRDEKAWRNEYAAHAHRIRIGCSCVISFYALLCFIAVET